MVIKSIFDIMDLKRSLGILAGITGISCSNPADAVNPVTQPPPNIVLITVHDLGQHLGCYGIPTVQSPNLDNLAHKGIMFKNFYSTSAVCSPGRGSLLTGRYPQSNGLMGLLHAPWWWELNVNEKHIAELLKNNGYNTTLIGLTHVGEPARLGFERHLSSKNNAEETVMEASNIFKTSGKKDKPFFLKIGFTEVHDPYKHGTDSVKGVFVPGFLMKTQEIHDEFTKFQGDIKFMDECVGKIINAIEKSEVADNTIIIFTSDHGIGFPGAKWTARKAGIEVPLIIYQPNSIFSGGKVYYEIMSNVDVLPTLFEYAGFSIPENIEGVSFKKFIAGETNDPSRKSVFAQYTSDMKRDNQSRTVISGKYQLIRYFDARRTVGYPLNISPSRFAAHTEREKTIGSRPFFELYNLEDDPFELINLGISEEYSEIAKELSKELMEWMKSVNDPLLKGPISTPYYEKSMEDFKRTAH
ncbi:MAG: sulfatase [bacterium]|nr:sulfatase [bacterium]